MMYIRSFFLYFFVFCTTTVLACKDLADGTTVVPLQAKICFTVKHHALIIPEAEVYLKLNGGETLGWDGKLYDRKIVANTSAKGCFEQLPIGTHWLMSYGYDTDARLDVLGKQSITIKNIDEQQEIVMEVSER